MSASTTNTDKRFKGGEYIIREQEASSIFIPEQFDEEQRMMADMARDFLATEVHPILDRIDAQEPGLMEKLLEKAGELGLLATSIPEQYEGFGKDFNTSLLMTEIVGAGHSFAVALAAHTGIGTLPILYFGTDEQKKKYLPKLASGQWKASYCLTEPGSGSDALAAKTKAVLSADGSHYILNGQKMWITNAGFADTFIVFAQIDGDKFTGFIVEKGEGVSLGNEEHKMGIKGSSTRQVFFNDCKVPKENVLGEIGKGHLIAFNILNIGRIKLAAAALGGSTRVSTLSIQYAKERIQFKQPIANFGAIQYKLAEQAIRIYTVQSAMYRAGQGIQDAEEELVKQGKTYEEALLAAAQEYAIECAMLKVAGSETLDYVSDEGVQILGGYGFSADYPMDRSYRDSRINRIFEGTNEINRMLTMDMFLKKAMKGELDLMGPAMAVQKELMAIPDFGAEDEGLFADEKKAIKNMKKALLMLAGAAAQKYMDKLATEQEILMNLADIAIDIYVAESTLMRTEKLISIKGEDAVKGQIDMTKVNIFDAADRINVAGKNAINSMSDGDMQRMMLMGLKRFTKVAPLNTKDARRRIAAQLIEANQYCF
ncbi:acyl-CoA dehydrogenase family protein [Cytophaga aurantiaca]|uniref:acyl-CoA dehydrogenase family protein n=1 Tax=Cytophaga aurantiaca TaxID=29530 RepID=UPI000380270C|nr:acyl-CoA dehydrogenase family protein [Cytophaga aurantiaca]